MSSSGRLNLKGLGRDSGKTRVLKRRRLDEVKIQDTCADSLDKGWAPGTVRTAHMEEWIIRVAAQSGDRKALRSPQSRSPVGLLPRPPSGPAHLQAPSLTWEVLPCLLKSGQALAQCLGLFFFFFFKHIGLVLDLEGYTRTYSAWRFPECVKSQSKFQKLKIVNNGCGGVCAAVSC